MNRLCCWFLTLCSGLVLCATGLRAQDDLLSIMAEELDHEFEVLAKADPPAYYIDYRINDMDGYALSSSFGSLINSGPVRSRTAFVRVKVGNYQRDNTHVSDEYGGFGGYGMPGLTMAIENKPEAIKYALWNATTNSYNQATEAYERVVDKADTSKIPDFSNEKPAQFQEPESDGPGAFKAAMWEKRITELSAPFAAHEDITSAYASLYYNVDRKYFTSTEGTRIVQNAPGAYMIITANIRAADGDNIPMYKTYFAFSPQNLPAQEAMLADVKELIKTLKLLKEAPLAEPYSGPAILAPEVSGVFFHEIFGHRIEGHRLKSEMDGQTFKEKVNEQVLDPSLSVISDPALTTFGSRDLIGTYKFDDEGVRGQRVTVVDKGRLKAFLMSRSPLEDFKKSNGHGRAQAGLAPVSRQSNLIIETNNPVSNEALRAELIAECKKQGKAYGYYFAEVTGGFTYTDRFTTNSFNIMPTLVYRVFVDGRPDQLVRGVDLIGTPLAMFAEILKAGDEPGTFTGICGAESGGVPVSATAPALYVRRIETQKKMKANSGEKPLLSRPNDKKEN